MASGAALPGAQRTTRPVRYPAQRVAMLEQTMADRIECEANERLVSQSQVIREYIELGMDEADARGITVNDQ